MKYKSCHLLEHGISIDVNSVKACCLSREFDKGLLMIVPEYKNGKIDWNKLFEIKKCQRNIQKEQNLPACEGCYNLREEDWDDEDYISFINFDHWSRCNSDCIYCNVKERACKSNPNILNAVKELIKLKKFRPCGEITFQGGEPTVLKEFDALLNLFTKGGEGSKIRVHSSGILFSRAIRNGLKKGAVSVVISPDSVFKDTYKKIKRVDKSDKVWDNIKHYRKDLNDDNALNVRVKYIIIPGVNDTVEEVNSFLNKLKELDIKSVIADIEYTYANRNINNISPHVYILLDIMEHFALQNNMVFDLYDSARYAVQNRKFEKISDYDSDNVNELFRVHKNNNLNQNINY